ncbi:MAG: aspartate ammonia-lyase [Clostridia bacterium]|nr:aspartate ammonia-lyase [Clostridia bacterium]
MTIGEAAKRAMETGGWMFRECEGWRLCVKPTDGFDCCKVMTIEPEGNKRPEGRRWNPRGCDLVANDWGVLLEEMA